MSSPELREYTRQYSSVERAVCAKEIQEGRAAGESLEFVRGKIATFYETEKAKQQEDIRAFDVEALAEDHNALLVSSIRSYGNLGPFRPLDTKAFKGVRLFDILLRPGQIVCGSSVMKGDSSANLYGNWGVIVGSGKVHQAFPYDATTSVVQGEIQSKFAPRLEGVRPSEQMMYALHARNLYNEINVSLGSIAGLYYCYDDEDAVLEYPARKFLDVIAPLEIPQYVLRRGEFYPIQDVKEVAAQEYDSPATPRQIVANGVVPTAEQIEYMVDYLSKMLTLAPRNAITSGVTRGEFVYEYSKLLATNQQNFFDTHERFLTDENPSLQLYGAMALHAYGEKANDNDDVSASKAARALAESALSFEQYREYKERILSTGNLCITADDLQYYMQHEELPPYLRDH